MSPPTAVVAFFRIATYIPPIHIDQTNTTGNIATNTAKTIKKMFNGTIAWPPLHFSDIASAMYIIRITIITSNRVKNNSYFHCFILVWNLFIFGIIIPRIVKNIPISHPYQSLKVLYRVVFKNYIRTYELSVWSISRFDSRSELNKSCYWFDSMFHYWYNYALN